MWIDDVFDEIGTGWYHVMQCCILGSVMMVDGAEILISSSILGALQDSWHLSDAEKSLMMSIVFIGVLIGGIVSGCLADIYGRKPMLQIAFAGICIFAGTSALSAGPWSMLLLRFCLGVSFGAGVPPCMGMLVETSGTKDRKFLINLGSAWFIMGELLASVLLMRFMPDLEDRGDGGWRIVIALAMTPSALVLPFLRASLQESPHFLLAQARKDEAVQALAHIARTNGAEDVAAGIAERGESSDLLASPVGGASPDPKAPQSLLEKAAVLAGPDYRGIVFGGVYLCFVVNMLGYGLNYALPQMFRDMRQELAPAWELFATSLADIPGFMLSMFVMMSARLGHRDGLALLAAGAAMSSLGLFEIDAGPSLLGVALASCYALKFTTFAWFSLVYIYLGEIFPSACRCSALAVCISGGRFGAICAPFLFELLVFERHGEKNHMAFFGLMSVLAFFGMVVTRTLLGFELKDRALEARRHRDPDDLRIGGLSEVSEAAVAPESETKS